MHSETPLIDVRDVCFAYGPVVALRNVALRLEPGTIGIVGNNGAGKSTLLKILLGLLRPQTGTGTVLGCSLAAGGARLRGLVGYMSEAGAAVPLLGGAEFVALSGELYGMPRRDAQRRAHEVLNYVGLGELRYRRLDEYSTGNLQRLKLAAALVHDPQLLLLDEPTNGLDPAGRQAMLRLIEDLIAETGKSVVLCTHLLADVERICRQVVVMHRGTVARAGSWESVRGGGRCRFTLAWQGDGERFTTALRAAGAELATADERRTSSPPRDAAGAACANVAVPVEWRTAQFFELAAATDVALVRLQPEAEDLERLFHRVTHGLDAAAQGDVRGH